MSGLAATGLLFTALSFVVATVAFIAPFWLKNENWDEQWGLWGICEKEDHCIWFFENDFAWESTLPTWHKACQVLYTLGVVIILCTFIFGCIHLCCAFQKNKGLNLAISGLLIVAFCCVVISVSVFGGRAHDLLRAGLYGNYIFKWAFFTAISSCVLIGLAALFYLCAGFKKDPYQGYIKTQPGMGNYAM